MSLTHWIFFKSNASVGDQHGDPTTVAMLPLWSRPTWEIPRYFPIIQIKYVWLKQLTFKLHFGLIRKPMWRSDQRRSNHEMRGERTIALLLLLMTCACISNYWLNGKKNIERPMTKSVVMFTLYGSVCVFLTFSWVARRYGESCSGWRTCVKPSMKSSTRMHLKTTASYQEKICTM